MLVGKGRMGRPHSQLDSVLGCRRARSVYESPPSTIIQQLDWLSSLFEPPTYPSPSARSGPGCRRAGISPISQGRRRWLCRRRLRIKMRTPRGCTYASLRTPQQQRSLKRSHPTDPIAELTKPTEYIPEFPRITRKRPLDWSSVFETAHPQKPH